MYQNPEAEKSFQSLAKEFQDAVQENARFQNVNLAKLLKDKLVILIDQINGYIQMNQLFLPLKIYQQNDQQDREFLQNNASYTKIKQLRDELDDKLKEYKGIINQVSHNLISQLYKLEKEPFIFELKQEETDMKKVLVANIEKIIDQINKFNFSGQSQIPLQDLYLQSMRADLQNYKSFLNKLKDIYISFWIDFKAMVFSFAQIRKEAPLKQDKITQIAEQFQKIYDRDMKQIKFIN